MVGSGQLSEKKPNWLSGSGKQLEFISVLQTIFKIIFPLLNSMVRVMKKMKALPNFS